MTFWVAAPLGVCQLLFLLLSLQEEQAGSLITPSSTLHNLNLSYPKHVISGAKNMGQQICHTPRYRHTLMEKNPTA